MNRKAKIASLALLIPAALVIALAAANPEIRPSPEFITTFAGVVMVMSALIAFISAGVAIFAPYEVNDACHQTIIVSSLIAAGAALVGFRHILF